MIEDRDVNGENRNLIIGMENLCLLENLPFVFHFLLLVFPDVEMSKIFYQLTINGFSLFLFFHMLTPSIHVFLVIYSQFEAFYRCLHFVIWCLRVFSTLWFWSLCWWWWDCERQKGFCSQFRFVTHEKFWLKENFFWSIPRK